MILNVSKFPSWLALAALPLCTGRRCAGPHCTGRLYWPLVLHCKKISDFPIPAGMSLTKPSQPGNNLFPPWESLVSDIPAGDDKIANLFYSVVPFH